MNKNWYAVITADVLYDKELTPRQKILVAVISNMSNEKGYCFASNAYLAELMDCSVRSIQYDLKVIENKYIGRVVHLKPNSEVDYRALTPVQQIAVPHATDCMPPHATDCTIITNTIKNKVNIPTLQEFLKYAKSILPNDYFDYKFSLEAKYQAWVDDGWRDGNKKKIKNWKTKLRSTIPYLRKYNPNKTKKQGMI